MKFIFASTILFLFQSCLAFFNWPLISTQVEGGVNGGTGCATCTLLVAIVSQTSDLYQISPEEAVERICGYFTQDILHTACQSLHDTYGHLVSYYLDEGYSPDETCLSLGACNDEDGQFCALFPGSDAFKNNNNNDDDDQSSSNTSPNTDDSNSNISDEPNICNLDGVREICDILSAWGNQHVPVDDVDGDWYSEVPSMRGTMWRGKDCNDLDPNIYPGKLSSIDGDRLIDTNCNGIYGIDNNTGRPYEDLYCKGSGQIGVVLFGDSAGAHFHIPPEWFNVTEMNQQVFDQMYFVLLNEIDWPQLSATTGIYNNTLKWEYIINGPVDSIYQKFLERNRCNHRDYQNLGVNGARSGAMANSLIKTIKRNSTGDNPVFIIYELIGNDVCSGHPGMSHMTTPDDFYQNNLKAFQYLDANIPYGSRVLALGLANGSVLYEAMHDRIHPIGWLNQDVTYSDLYDYLNCLQVSPCYGWMNSNATMRQLTTDRAMELSATLKNLTETVKFENITIEYIDFPIMEIIQEWHESGGQTWQLIEPVDGFHPNQFANSLLANNIYQHLLENITDWIPPINPHNDEIIKIFGDQGGY